MKPTIAVIANSKYYKEYRSSCAYYLSKLGWHTKQYDTIIEGKSCDILIIVGMAFFPKVPFYKGKTLIGIQGEQLPLPGDKDWSLKRNLKRFKAMAHFYNLVIEWSPQNYEHYTCPVPRKFIPFGAPKPSAHPKSNTWDAVFLGNPYGGNGRRIPILEKVHEICKLNPEREAWGDQKFEILNTTKICLNLHQFETHSFESPRIFELLSEGCFVLSEPIQNSFPFEAGKHFIEFDGIDDLKIKINYFLNHQTQREQIAAAGQVMAQSYTQKQMIKLLSDEIKNVSRFKSLELIRYSRWLKGKIKNSLIEFWDVIAKTKRKIIL
ncbi:glycosyltransferase [Flavobacteriaceae bacterium]|nr:glycosyltransferase [Flavobacteriaceae bacterium]